MGENSNDNDLRRSSDMSTMYRIEAQNSLLLTQMSGVVTSQKGLESRFGQMSESMARIEQNVGHVSNRQDRTEDDLKGLGQKTDVELKDLRKELNTLDKKVVWYGGALAVLSAVGYLLASGYLGQIGRSIANTGMTP